jgi:hypothetical protein
MKTRTCGECQACCELPMVVPLKKPMFTRCANQCAEGCAIYAERPEPCRDFACSWLRGDALLGDDDRPDTLGLLVETCVSEQPGGDSIQYVQLWETRAGVLAESGTPARALYEGLAMRWPLKVQRYKGPTRYQAPPHLAAVARELERRAKAAKITADPSDPCPCGSGALFRDCHARR